MKLPSARYAANRAARSRTGLGCAACRCRRPQPPKDGDPQAANRLALLSSATPFNSHAGRLSWSARCDYSGGHPAEQLPDRQFQRGREILDVDQADVASARSISLQISSVDACLLRQVFLSPQVLATTKPRGSLHIDLRRRLQLNTGRLLGRPLTGAKGFSVCSTSGSPSRADLSRSPLLPGVTTRRTCGVVHATIT